MSKIADYLGERLTGEVAADVATRENFSTDGSIFKVTPQLVVYPRTTNDIRKVVRFSWRLAERGQAFPITARGFGTDPTGAAIGSGAILSFASHMSRILELDVKSQMVRVQPGLNINVLQEALATHGLFLPVKPSEKFATIGGMLAQNISGSKYAKYGSMLDQVDRIEVVLANGEVIQTGRVNKRELSMKKGLQTMEGEIYRALDALIDENIDSIDMFGRSSDVLNRAGFPIHLVKGSDGSFDLTPLIVGAQGTLGIINQAILQLIQHPTEITMVAATLTHDQATTEIIEKITDLDPSEFRFIDGDTLNLIKKINGDTRWWKDTSKNESAALIFMEFDDKHQARSIKKLTKLFETIGLTNFEIATNYEEQERLRSIRDSVNAVSGFEERGTAALPIASNMSVAPSRVFEFAVEARKVLSHNHIDGGIWGDLGSGVITVKPLINLANLGQRQTVFKFIREMHEKVIEFNGSISGEFGDGRLNAPFAVEQYGNSMLEIFTKIKNIFDPYNMLNPNVKIGTTRDDLLKNMRQEYSANKIVF
ncbi:MAG: FAD-binding oxidoreductase [Candidatus Nomurabacteria bacterium]|jgi:FAD/FMN-containing dehydrogenase|nr:FAD-binding oxidoreductase [Candidatus Nomurabacteria bacterium]